MDRTPAWSPRAVASRTGRARTIGLTGAPGAGKSTLTDALVGHLRRTHPDRSVGVLAVDPSSPFSGGAILGDRVRMQSNTEDEGVFIRSMASRGHLGGIALSTPEAIRVLDAAGFPLVLVETVGVGQVEIAIAGTADTTVVVVNPGWGDAVQANKAGLLEVADVLVVNKADRHGTEATVRDLQGMLAMRPMGAWLPPVVATIAHDGTGVADLAEALDRHRTHLETSGELAARRRRRVQSELREIVLRRLEEGQGGIPDDLVEAVLAGWLDPWAASDRLLG